MPARKPLVIINGVTQQLPAGDTLDASASEVDVVSLTNAAGSAAVIGIPVYISAANAFQPARANASGTCDVAGLVKDTSIAAGASGSVQTDGVFTASTAQWDAVTGGTGGLTPGAIYYLSAGTAGRLTATAPSSTGEFVSRVGKALSTTALEITIQPPIGL